jgi:hypothetical protein
MLGKNDKRAKEVEVGGIQNEGKRTTKSGSRLGIYAMAAVQEKRVGIISGLHRE